MTHLRVFYNMVDQGHYGWALSWCMLIVRTTCPILSNNKLKERSEIFRATIYAVYPNYCNDGLSCLFHAQVVTSLLSPPEVAESFKHLPNRVQLLLPVIHQLLSVWSRFTASQSWTNSASRWTQLCPLLLRANGFLAMSVYTSHPTKANRLCWPSTETEQEVQKVNLPVQEFWALVWLFDCSALEKFILVYAGKKTF